MFDEFSQFVTYVLLFLILFCVGTCFYTRRKRSFVLPPKNTVKTMIVIGSGGHTSEMMRIVKRLNNEKFSPRLYIIADSDTTSLCKVTEFENAIEGVNQICQIPRSRKVHQSYISSVFTTLYSLLHAIPVVLRNRPDLILCNGPGTCVPICIVAFLSNIFLFYNVKVIFIESLCRVKTLSLTGKILIHFADLMIVQWPELKKLYKNTVYIGDVKL